MHILTLIPSRCLCKQYWCTAVHSYMRISLMKSCTSPGKSYNYSWTTNYKEKPQPGLRVLECFQDVERACLYCHCPLYILSTLYSKWGHHSDSFHKVLWPKDQPPGQLTSTRASLSKFGTPSACWRPPQAFSGLIAIAITSGRDWESTVLASGWPWTVPWQPESNEYI